MGREDPLEKEMVTQYSCLENPMDSGLQFMWSQRVRHDLATKHHDLVLSKKVIFKLKSEG